MKNFIKLLFILFWINYSSAIINADILKKMDNLKKEIEGDDALFELKKNLYQDKSRFEGEYKYLLIRYGLINEDGYFLDNPEDTKEILKTLFLFRESHVRFSSNVQFLPKEDLLSRLKRLKLLKEGRRALSELKAHLDAGKEKFEGAFLSILTIYQLIHEDGSINNPEEMNYLLNREFSFENESVRLTGSQY